jgi:hypothetical protein
MSRVSQSQRQRTQKNPLVLGTFSETSLRVLTGTLGPVSKVVGRADTNQYSNGGIGGGTYNHWFQINVTSPSWIITKKGGPRPNYIQVSAYDLNFSPIQGRMIFQHDSVSDSTGYLGLHYPYSDHVMGAPSNLYNYFNQYRLDKGNDLYFDLERGSYLICVSSTRNELLDYTLGVVIEFPSIDMFFLLEDVNNSYLVTESNFNLTNTVLIGPTFSVDYTIPTNYNAFTSTMATINNGVIVTIPENSTWYIGFLNIGFTPGDLFIIEESDSYDTNSIHEHSYTEWLTAWKRERSPEDSLPTIFDSLITSS